MKRIAFWLRKLVNHPAEASRRTNVEILGVTMGWDLKPTRLYRWPDNFVGILPREAECLIGGPYSTDGRQWPLDPITGADIPLYQ